MKILLLFILILIIILFIIYFQFKSIENFTTTCLYSETQKNNMKKEKDLSKIILNLADKIYANIDIFNNKSNTKIALDNASITAANYQTLLDNYNASNEKELFDKISNIRNRIYNVHNILYTNYLLNVNKGC